MKLGRMKKQTAPTEEGNRCDCVWHPLPAGAVLSTSAALSQFILTAALRAGCRHHPAFLSCSEGK